MSLTKTVVVLGAGGTIGQVIAWDWCKSSRHHHVILADRNQDKIQGLAKRLGRRAQAITVDLHKKEALVKVLRQSDLVINSTSHHFNLPVMEAAVLAKIHYLDLGGLFHYTRRQLKFNAAFAKIKKTALLGMGCAPGVSNLMAKTLTEDWEIVHSLEIKVAGIDRQPQPLGALPYSWRTLYEELTLKPAVFHDGRWTFTKPLSGLETFRFSPPVGAQKVFYTLHSEVATLPVTFQTRGIQHVSFQIGLGEELQKTVFQHAHAPKLAAGAVAPPAARKVMPDDYEITAVVAEGKRRGRLIRRVMEFHSQALHGWRAGDLNTACPASVAAALLLQGEGALSGVLVPEEMSFWSDFKKQLENRHFIFIEK